MIGSRDLVVELAHALLSTRPSPYLVTGEHEERVYAEQCQRRGVLAL